MKTPFLLQQNPVTSKSPPPSFDICNLPIEALCNSPLSLNITLSLTKLVLSRIQEVKPKGLYDQEVHYQRLLNLASEELPNTCYHYTITVPFESSLLFF